MIWAGYRRYVRRFGAGADIQDFFYTYWVRAQTGKLRTPKAMDDAFADPQSDEERKVKALIAQFNAAEASRIEREIFAQRARLVAAERKFAKKATKAATGSTRIATSKVDLQDHRDDALIGTRPARYLLLDAVPSSSWSACSVWRCSSGCSAAPCTCPFVRLSITSEYRPHVVTTL